MIRKVGERTDPTADEALAPDEAPPAREGGNHPLAQRVEAVLFASGEALSASRIASILDGDLPAVAAALQELAAAWRAREGAIELVEISGGWQLLTRSEFHPDLAGLARKGRTERLSPAALESLAVVAYRQPVSRADLESIRGVQSGPLLRVLLDRDLIRVVGRSPDPGHPLLYGTTKRFLDHFGLPSLAQLPDFKELLDVS